MKTFNMYVKTVIYNENDKVLLLKQKKEDNTSFWDLPGAVFTEEQSFDETVTTNVQKEIGYYVYPGKIIGIGDYSDNEGKNVYVIMDGTILNGELLLSKDYETSTWVDINRIKDYPLVPWLKKYVQNTKDPFQDVEVEIEELTNKKQRRREVIQEDLMSSIDKDKSTEKDNNGVKSSFSLLKDTIKKTFHPREAKVSQTSPKTIKIHQEDYTEQEDRIRDKLNIRRKKDEPSEEYLEKVILSTNDDDIIIDHESNDNDEIIIEKENNDIILEPVAKTHDKKIEPEIKVIREDEKTPLIRKEKESKRVSFNTENLSGWKDRLNRLNRTEANNEKKTVPKPKGKRK